MSKYIDGAYHKTCVVAEVRNGKVVYFAETSDEKGKIVSKVELKKGWRPEKNG